MRVTGLHWTGTGCLCRNRKLAFRPDAAGFCYQYTYEGFVQFSSVTSVEKLNISGMFDLNIYQTFLKYIWYA
jgi:hypothetical protein